MFLKLIINFKYSFSGKLVNNLNFKPSTLSMNSFPSRNLFSNPNSPQNTEPQPNKKLFIEQPFTPDFGRISRLPIKISPVPQTIYQKN